MAFLQLLTANAAGGASSMGQLTASKDFARFLTVNNLTYTHEAGIAWLMLEATDAALGANTHVPRVPNDQNALTCAIQPAAGAAPGTAVTYHAPNGALTQVLAEAIPISQFRLLLGDYGKAFHWVLNLAGCHQVKPLKAQNVMNYFRSNSRITITGREVIKVVDYAAVALPSLMNDEAFRDAMEDTQFMTYHTSYSSTAGLAQEMLSSAPAITNLLFSQASRNAIAASKNSLHDAALNALIPPMSILATYAYLQAFQKLPDGWFQGEKAKTTLPATRYAAYFAIFRKLRELSADVAAITNAADMDSLIAAIGADLQNV